LEAFAAGKSSEVSCSRVLSKLYVSLNILRHGRRNSALLSRKDVPPS
jgi:hypothetical protein